MTYLAFSSKHPFVPNPSKKPLETRWIASLSNGTTVFEDVTPGIESAWHRLTKYIDVHKLKLTNLRLEAYGRQIILVPYISDDGRAQVNGYFYSKRQNFFVSSSGSLEWLDVGIGFLKGKQIYITWVTQDGSVKQEIREYTPGNLAVIVNDPP